jgi:hypothetical protein
MIGAQRLMLKHCYPSRVRLTRLLLPVFVASILLLNAGCGLFGAKRKISVPQLLTPLAEANRDRLIQEVNRLSTVKSIHGKVDIQFEDTSFASSGIADQYRLVDGTITLQRPGQIYLVIQFTFVDIAQMASDGQHFTVAVLQGNERYKRFVKGTNSAVYPKLDTDANHTTNSKQKTEKEAVSALSNLRPQHLTDAFMIRPIEPNTPSIYAQSEFFQEEADPRRQAKKGDRVMRGYYLLEEFSQPQGGEAKITRRFWFDRVSGIRLARVQTYDDRGSLITDVAYFNEKTLGSGPTALLPSRIEITRPQDQYKLSITYQDAASVDLNREYAPKAFVLENRWQLPELDLDAQNKKVTANQ